MDQGSARQQRPPFPAAASAASSMPSSASHSSSSLSTLSSQAVAQAHQQQQGTMPPSSPTQQGHFFGSLHAQNMAAPQAAQAPPQASTSNSWNYHPNRDGAGRTAQETAALLSEYSLVAEAAKRAQMAVLMRDLEGVELS